MSTDEVNGRSSARRQRAATVRNVIVSCRRERTAVVPNYNGDEKRLVPAALMETCMTKTRQNSSEHRHRRKDRSGSQRRGVI